MSVLLIFQRMLMLLAMMTLGYAGYKVKWIDDHSYSKLSAIVVNIFNPALVINGALAATAAGSIDFSVVKENIYFVLVYYCISINIIHISLLLKRSWLNISLLYNFWLISLITLSFKPHSPKKSNINESSFLSKYFYYIP